MKPKAIAGYINSKLFQFLPVDAPPLAAFCPKHASPQANQKNESIECKIK
jgi:hypothetical protein